MEAALFVAIFFPIVCAMAVQERRRSAESFSSVSVITGSDIVLKVTALPDSERRLAAYRKSPESRLLNLKD